MKRLGAISIDNASCACFLFAGNHFCVWYSSLSDEMLYRQSTYPSNIDHTQSDVRLFVDVHNFFRYLLRLLLANATTTRSDTIIIIEGGRWSWMEKESGKGTEFRMPSSAIAEPDSRTAG